MKKKNTIQSVDRALEILCILGNSNEPITIQTLSRLLDIPRTTLYTTINSLEEYGFITKNEMIKTISLGWRLYSLGTGFLKNQLNPVAQEVAEKLRLRWNLTVHIGVYAKDNKIVFILSKLPDKPFMISPRLGFVTQAHHTSSGKVLLAHLKPDELEWLKEPGILTRRTSTTITDPEKLIQELNTIHTQGWAIDNEESISGLFCVAAPIKNYLGECVASISVSGPKDIVISNLEEIKEDVQLAANHILQSSGFYPG